MTNAAKNRIYIAIIAALAAIIAAMGYKFIVVGSVERADDGRLSVALDPSERALMLREMRGFVAGLQAIADGLARDDMKAVATASRGMGMARAHDAPAAMMGKLPLEFKTLYRASTYCTVWWCGEIGSGRVDAWFCGRERVG